MAAAFALNLFRPDTERKATYLARRAEFLALVEGWKRFCAYAGFEPDTVLKAFGLELDSMLDDVPIENVELDENEVEIIYQSCLKLWA